MKTIRHIVALLLLAPAGSLLAGEDLALDKNFSFRLTAPDLQPLPPVRPPVFLSKPEKKRAAPPTTPEGVPLPPGSRAFKFNGGSYYFIPL